MARKEKLTVESAAKEWIELKSMDETIERRREELRAILLPALEAAPDQVLELHGWRFVLVKFLRDAFSLSKAREKIDGRVLAPYITTTEVESIRATWKGGKPEAKA